MDRELIQIQEAIYETVHPRPFIKRSGKWGVKGTAEFDSRDEKTTYKKYYYHLKFKNLI